MQNQHLLGSILRFLFPSNRILSNARKAAANINPSTNQWLEVDYYIPDLKLGFEFQDFHHFATAYYARVPVDHVQQRDFFKIRRVREKGESLISIPCWWDGLPGSLIATIREARSDLLQNYNKSNGVPIPSSPPHGFFGEFVPDVGELMISLYAFPARLKASPIWWMSEKYDGIRACWNPSRLNLFSRSGRIFDLPQAFFGHFPSGLFLDCEVWFGRGAFHESQLLALDFNRSYSSSNLRDPLTHSFSSRLHWPSLRAIAFDHTTPKKEIDQTKNEDDPFELRFRTLLDTIPVRHPFIMIANNIKTTPKQLHGFSSIILSDGGEGVMLRAPNTAYSRGLSPNLLKLKAQRDNEALVVEKNGPNYELELPDGTRFTSPTSQGLLVSVGDVVTFTYTFSKNNEEERQDGDFEGWVPLDPVIARVRKDVIWEEMILDYGTKPRERNANSLTQKLLKDTKNRHPPGHWTCDDNKNAKELFSLFAHSRNCSAQDPEFWYSVKRSELLQEKRTVTIIKNYGGSCARAVLDLFPNIGLDRKRLFHHKGIRIRKSNPSSGKKVPMHKKIKSVLWKTSGIMKIWWKVHKSSVA